MQDIKITPNKSGQICKIINPLGDENPDDVYIVAEDPTPFDIEDSIYVINLNDLQRNLRTPHLTPQIAINKGDLTAIAEDLTEYIGKWNK